MSVDAWEIGHLPSGQRPRELSARFMSVPVGGSVILIGRRTELDELREAFDRDWSGAYEWRQGAPATEPSDRADNCEDQVVKRAASMLPRVLADAMSVSATAAEGGRGGAAWRLQPTGRQLDANVIYLTPGDRVDAPAGSDLDVLMVVLTGRGELVTELGSVALEAGRLAWLPRGSGRSIAAAEPGLSYLTVHVRRPPMGIGRPSIPPTPPDAA